MIIIGLFFLPNQVKECRGILQEIVVVEWSWDPSGKTWNKQYNSLKEFLKNNNNKYPREKSTGEEHKILAWIKGQKTQHKKGSLSDENIAKLEELPRWKWINK